MSSKRAGPQAATASEVCDICMCVHLCVCVYMCVCVSVCVFVCAYVYALDTLNELFAVLCCVCV